MSADAPTSLPEPQSIFGRLACFSRLRNPDTGEYDLAGEKSSYLTSRLLRTEHEEAFARWLAYSVREKRADLERYLAELGHDRLVVLCTWRRLRTYRTYVPASAGPAEEALYVCDLETLIEVLSRELMPEREVAAATVRDWRVREITFRAETSFGDVGLTLKELAASMRISSPRLGVLFKKTTGLSFRNYIRGIRMRRALVLLANPLRRVVEVAGALGYSSSTSFIHDFRKHFGFSPAQYRSGSRQEVGKRTASYKTATA
jgi:AraC-like DNA-binding protein